MAPSLTDSFTLFNLPRAYGQSLRERAVISPIESAGQTSIDIGISKSSISTYVLKPTPKLVWSYALPPTAVVSTLISNERDGNKIYAAGITERKQNKILVIETGKENVGDITINVKSKVIDMNFIDETILIVYENGTIELLQYKSQELISAFKQEDEIIYHSFISKDEFNTKHDMILTIHKDNSKLRFKLIGYDRQKILEITTANLETDKQYSTASFTYRAGIIYALSIQSKSICLITVNGFRREREINVEHLIKSSNSGIIAPSSDRLLLSSGDSIHLLNTKFESKLASFTTEGCDLQVIELAPVAGKSLRTSKSMVVYLKSGKKDTSLNVINIDVGLNKLSECLGKSINIAKRDVKGFASILDDDIESGSKKSRDEAYEVLEKLQQFKKSKDLNSWERVVTPYLKNEPWSEIKLALKNIKNKEQKTYQFQGFDVETDRVVDYTFVTKILDIVFDYQNGEMILKDVDFLPEHSLIYLLTSPMYPEKWSKGLLKLFDDLDQTTLLRQAVLTCPSILINDLLYQFAFTPREDEIYEDILNRLATNYSIKQITLEFKAFMEKFGEINLETMLVNLVEINTSNSWQLVESIVDVGGLFTWSLDTITKLSEFVDSKINTVTTNNFNLMLVNQALEINEPMKKKPAKNKRKSDIVSANEEQQQQQLDSILTLNNTSSKKLLEKNSSVASRSVPVYSLERLII